MSEDALPGMPEYPKPIPRPAPTPGVRATRIHVASLCEQCCADIHRFGQACAPYPKIARWRVVAGQTVGKLCDQHKDERL